MNMNTKFQVDLMSFSWKITFTKNLNQTGQGHTNGRIDIQMRFQDIENGWEGVQQVNV